MNLNDIQTNQKMWQLKNFPNAKNYQPLLGIVEEVGELSHSHLKMEQGIRGTKEEHKLKIKDAIGDIVIFLAGYCNINNINLDSCVEMAWEEVKKRDWGSNKNTGIKIDSEVQDGKEFDVSGVKLTFKKGVIWDGMHEMVELGARVVNQVFNEYGEQCTITSGKDTDPKRLENTLHDGRAWDVRTRDIKDDHKLYCILSECDRRLKAISKKFQFENEVFDKDNSRRSYQHFHFEYDNRKV